MFRYFIGYLLIILLFVNACNVSFRKSFYGGRFILSTQLTDMNLVNNRVCGRASEREIRGREVQSTPHEITEFFSVKACNRTKTYICFFFKQRLIFIPKEYSLDLSSTVKIRRGFLANWIPVFLALEMKKDKSYDSGVDIARTARSARMQNFTTRCRDVRSFPQWRWGVNDIKWMV